MQQHDVMRWDGKLAHVLDRVSDHFAVLDREGRCLYANSSVAAALGVERDELVGVVPWERFPALAGSDLERAFHEALASGEERRFEYTGLLVDRRFEVTVSPGDEGVSFIARDVTAREAAEQATRTSEHQFRTIAETLPEVIWTCRPDGAVDYINQRWTALTGLPPERAYEWGWMEVLHPRDRERTLAKWRRGLAGGESLEGTYRVRAAGGSYRWQLVRAAPLRDEQGRISRWFGVNVDIEDQKRAEEAISASHRRAEQARRELQQLAEGLEHRVAERTAEAEQRATQLRELAAQLSTAEERERRKLAVMLHDQLQQVLAAARIRLELVRHAQLSPELSRRIEEVYELIGRSIESSRSLALEISPPILYESGLVAALGWLALWMRNRHGLDVKLAAEPGAEPQSSEVRVMLFQMARELLLNVVAHAGVVEARLELAARDDAVRLEVSDAGAGFDPAAVHAEGPVTRFGLLSIRERIEVLGGSFAVDSHAGAGTRVRIELPARLVEPARSELGERPRDAARRAFTAADERIRVLLADDHQVVRQGLAGVLEGEPDIAVVGEAADGEAAVLLARQLSPDVVIMDVSMPRLNGIEATRVVTRELPSVTVIGLSMHHEEHTAALMRTAGAAAYLTKDGPVDELIQQIRGVRQRQLA